MQLSCPTLEFHVECADGTKLHPQTMAELVALPNPVNREITSVRIRTPWGRDVPTNFSITLTDDPFLYDLISYSVSGDDSNVLAVSTHIDNWIDAIKVSAPLAGFGPFERSLFSGGFFVLGIALLFASTIGVYLHLRFGWFGIAVGGLLVLFARTAQRARRYLYHAGEFEIGDGIARSTRRRGLRANLFWSVLIAPVIGLLFLFLGIWMSHHS